jgi:hypothetical protein
MRDAESLKDAPRSAEEGVAGEVVWMFCARNGMKMRAMLEDGRKRYS